MARAPFSIRRRRPSFVPLPIAQTYRCCRLMSDPEEGVNGKSTNDDGAAYAPAVGGLFGVLSTQELWGPRRQESE